MPTRHPPVSNLARTRLAVVWGAGKLVMLWVFVC
jgi:hypothetical protein